MRSINEISESVRRDERISAEDALKLWREAPLWLLGELATERKERRYTTTVMYTLSQQIYVYSTVNFALSAAERGIRMRGICR